MTAEPAAPGDLVWVPFPHVEDNRLRSRPAVIVATGLAGKHDLCWALMVTATANEPWPEDVPIADHRAVGLAIPSSVRVAKVATLSAAAATRIGQLPTAVWAEVRGRFAGIALAGEIPNADTRSAMVEADAILAARRPRHNSD